MPEIAGTKEAFAIELDERRRRGLGALPVAFKHFWPVHHDLALLAHAQLRQTVRIDHTGIGAHERNTQALLLGCVGRIRVRWRRSFRQAVAFGIAQAVLVLQALRHGLWHGGAAASDIDQA